MTWFGSFRAVNGIQFILPKSELKRHKPFGIHTALEDDAAAVQLLPGRCAVNLHFTSEASTQTQHPMLSRDHSWSGKRSLTISTAPTVFTLPQCLKKG